MKKTFIFGLMAAALGFTACSNEDDLMVRGNQKGMVLRATVEQPAETRATINDSEATWKFAFATDDRISVTNSAVTGTYYTFTNDGTDFWSTDAQATESETTWYAYFPSDEVDLVGQSGTMEAVAGKYALAGKTASATTGKDGLSITMSPKVAILKIYNKKGSIDINVKVSATEWVKGLTASEDGFTVTTAEARQTLLSVTAAGTYYVAVPAGVQISVKDGDNVIRSTGTSGLTAGMYYELAIGTLEGSTGYASATGITGGVKWVQLWEGGPRFAEYNVGVTDGKAESYGGYYEWSDDVASTQWGDNWRTPTSTELQALVDNCDAKWTNNYNNSGRTGYIFTGKGYYSGNSIFLPAAGCCFPGSSLVCYDGSDGLYWSSTFYDVDDVYYLHCLGMDHHSRGMRYSVRAVLNETTGATATGTATATIGGVDTDVKWIQLWKDGPKFAEHNIGATSATEPGNHYTWTYNSALTQWGGNWCVPTKADFDNLLANCDVEWTDDYKNDGTNIKGLIITGKDAYSFNSIFLPAAGYNNRGFDLGQGSYGNYWTSTQNGSSEACGLVIDSSSQLLTRFDISDYSFSLRAVLNESPFPTTGTTMRNGDISVKWVQLWKDGLKFAEYNVGATSVTEDGGYYAWGSSTDKDPDGYYKDRYKDLTGSDDTATNLWGDNWRMPTSEEFQALIANCDVTWTTDYNNSGIMGEIFTGKGYYSSNSIFLPAAGYYSYLDNKVIKGKPRENNPNMYDYYGCYWTSTHDVPTGEDNAARYLSFTTGYMPHMDTTGRHTGSSVRAVLKEE
ncbi:MAG: hypothetical protein Q4A08_08890 [Bacteroidales bacterium]|nr:hypothetical protein [Bacteroidales bacterium]